MSVETLEKRITDMGAAIYLAITDGRVDVDPEALDAAACEDLARWVLEEYHQRGEECLGYAADEHGYVDPGAITVLDLVEKRLNSGYSRRAAGWTDVYAIYAEGLYALLDAHEAHDTRWPVAQCEACRPIHAALMLMGETT